MLWLHFKLQVYKCLTVFFEYSPWSPVSHRCECAQNPDQTHEIQKVVFQIYPRLKLTWTMEEKG